MSPKALAVVAVGVVSALVVAGLFAAGSPGTARKIEADLARVRSLSELHHALESHFQRTGSLPSSIRSVDLYETGFAGEDPRRDPETDRFYEYRMLSPTRYEVCAVFATSSDDRRYPQGVHEGNRYRHDAGQECFRREVRPLPGAAGPGPRPILPP